MITYDLTYNGFREIDTKRGLFIDYEFINYGFINNNYSEIKKRIYKIENNDFIREYTIYKNAGIFEKLVSHYIELQKQDYKNILDEYATKKRLTKCDLNDIINMCLALEIFEFKGLTFNIELSVTEYDKNKVNVLKKYHNSSNYLHNQFIESHLVYNSFYKSNKRSFDFIRGV